MIKKTIVFGLVAVMMMSLVFAWDVPPLCTPEPLPPAPWIESFDGTGYQSYCVDSPGVVWIEQPLFTNRLGQYFTPVNSDMWTVIDYEIPTGNIRNVEITFEYLAPSKEGVCIHSEINPVTGLYNSPQSILVGNKNTNLSTKDAFDVAFYDFNQEIVCDQWITFSHRISEFTNDFGSSFSGQSKDLGSIGFEAKNIYIRNVVIDGSGGTLGVW